MLKSNGRKYGRSQILLVALCATFSTPLFAQNTQTLTHEEREMENRKRIAVSVKVAKVTARLHSKLLKAEAEKQAQLLVSGDFFQADSAIDFFHDLRAKELLVYALEHRGGSNSTLEHVVQALQDISSPGDKALIAFTTRLLERNIDVLQIGGTEDRLFLAAYQKSLIHLLEKLTATTLLPPKDEHPLPQDSEEALTIKIQRLIPSNEELTKAVDGAKDWLKKHGG